MSCQVCGESCQAQPTPPTTQQTTKQPQQPAPAGGKRPTKQRIQMGGRSAIVYEGARGGKYVKKGGEFVSLSALKK